MSALRWILLILGIGLIVGIYFIGRRKQRSHTVREEPALDRHSSGHSHEARPAEPKEGWEYEAVDFDALIVQGLQSEVADFKTSNSGHGPQAEQPPAAANKAKAQPSGPSMLLEDDLVVLHLLAPSGQTFNGEILYRILNNVGFERLEQNIFTYRGQEGHYLAVNALKPGTFPEQAEQLQTKALALILRLSQVKAPLAAFDELLLCARFLQEKLDARLCDAQRSSLTVQTIHYLQEEIQAYQLKHCQ